MSKENTTEQEEKKSTKSKIILIVVLLLGVCSAVAFLYYKKYYLDPAQLQGGITDAQLILLEENTKKRPQSIIDWVALANAYYDRNEVKKSIFAYEKALELSKNNPSPSVLTDYATMLRADGQYELALENYNHALKISPTHPVAQYNIALLLFYNLQKPQEALVYFKKLLAVHPNAASPDGKRIADVLKQLYPQEKF